MFVGTKNKYRGADKSLARPTSRCVLLDGENISFYASLVIYMVSQEECARLREGFPYVKVYRYNPKHLCPKLNVYGDIYIYIQGVPGGMCRTSVGYSLC
jgi:hypothetical protein